MRASRTAQNERSLRRGARSRWLGALAGLALAVWTARAGAQTDAISPDERVTLPPASTYVHFFTALSLGDSLRLNNPFRLSNQIGDSASLSRTPLYGDLQAAVALGQPDGWQHGAVVHWSYALSGLPQHVLAPGYLLLQDGWRPWLAHGRVSVPIVLNPDPNVGVEAAIGGTYLLFAGIGAQIEIIGDVFYGAATWTTQKTVIPMLSMQAGITVDYEVLP